MSRTEFIPIKDRFPHLVDGFLRYASSVIFLLAGVAFVLLSIKGVVEFRHLFWLVPVSTIATFILLVLAWAVLEVLFLGLRYTWYLVLGMLKEWRRQAENFFLFAYLNAFLFLVLLISLLIFLLQSLGAR